MDPELPLDEDELDRLDEFLRSSAVGDDAMDASMLDGFLTALAVGPHNLPPAQWLGEIWGREIAWPSAAEENRIRTLVLRHANALLFQLRETPEDFEPLLWEREIDGRRVPTIAEWCAGFVRGMALDEAGWQPLLDDGEQCRLLDVILLHGTEEGARELEHDPSLDGHHQLHAASLGNSAAALMAHWLPQRRRSTTLRRDAAKTGRNDPCPCGSGEKFKKCCGNDRRLH